VRVIVSVADRVHQLLVTDVALDKLGARQIAAVDAEQLLRNPHVIVRNPRSPADPGKRRGGSAGRSPLLHGQTFLAS
jgi:hypothetical protein